MNQPHPILVVDDEEIVRRMVADVLEMGGYETRTAESGDEAYRLLREAGARYQMVITDNNMPGMQGLELLAKIRAIDAKMPIVLMTAYGRIETSIEAYDLGADGFLLKPFDDIHMILEEVQAVFARVKRRREHGR